jgi:hypothetical protein
MSKLRKNLRGDKRMNAFNEEFDILHLVKEVQKAQQQGEDARDLAAALFSPFFNALYSEYYNKAKQALQITELTVDEIEESMLANSNRNYLLITRLSEQKLIRQVKKDKGLVFANEGIKINSVLMGAEIDAADAIDNTIDALNMLFSYLGKQPREYDDSILDNELPEPQSINLLIGLYISSSRISAFKSAYDSMIWENRYVTTENNEHTIRFKDKDFAILSNVNKAKAEQQSSAYAITLFGQVKQNEFKRKTLEDLFRANRKAKSIDKVKVSSGYITPIIKDGYSKDHLFHDITLFTSVAASYDYILQTKLPKLNSLIVNDIIILYAEVRELLIQTQKLKFDEKGYLTVGGLYDYPFRISVETLLEYLKSKTYYTLEELNFFINLITHTEGRINFWKRPFLKRGDDLLFPILPLVASRLLYVIDEWLEAGGFSLDERGHIFEKHIKDSIQSIMDDKGYTCNIYKNQFLRFGEEAEEIDLLVEFKECILIAEVKCIGYPLESRDNFNAHKRLTEGASQLNRKVNFINKNLGHFVNDIPGLSSKPIIKAVIANYSLLSTHEIEGVVISDINTIEYYMEIGQIHEGMISIDKFGEKDTSAAKLVKLYNNESEFCKNFQSHLVNPISLNALKSASRIEVIEMTEQSAQTKLFAEGIKLAPGLMGQS